MEFCYIFIPNDVVEVILDNINDLHTMFNLVQSCSYLFTKYKNVIPKYKLEKCLYRNYIKFHYLLEFYSKTINNDTMFIQNLYKKAVYIIPTVWKNNCCGFVDLRYIFELLYYCNIEDERNISLVNPNFYRLFYKKIISNIEKNNRTKTIENLQKSHPVLACLKKSFVPNSYRNKQKWDQLIE